MTIDYNPVMSQAADPDVRLLAALADPVRLAIVRQLCAEGTVCACDFDPGIGVSQPTVSHHLKVLREAGVVRGERRGTWLDYSLDPAVAGRLQSIAASLTPARSMPASALRGQRLPVLQEPPL